MTTFNYRIIHHDLDPDPEKQWYGLHEVYYDDPDSDTSRLSWTAEPVEFTCDLDEGSRAIKEALEHALACVSDRRYPVLKESELERDHSPSATAVPDS